MRERSAAMLLGCGILAVGACRALPATGLDESAARVRVVNASMLGTSADVLLDGVIVASRIGYRGSTSACVDVPAGTRTLTVQVGGSTVASTVPTNFQERRRYTLVLSGASGMLDATVIDDNAFVRPPNGMNAFRLFNAMTAAIGRVYVTEPAAPIAGEPSFALTDLAPGAATSSFVEVPIPYTRLRAYALGETTFTTPMVDFLLPSLGEDRFATLIITGPNGTPAARDAFVVETC